VGEDLIQQLFGWIRVYRLVEPDRLAANASVLATVLFGMRAVPDGDRTLSVHPASGNLYFADHGELWQNPEGAGLPASADQAERLARAFLSDSNRRVIANHTLRQEGVPPLFPEDVRPTWIGAAMPRGGNAPDHWLCRFDAYLPADIVRTARVEGASIDVRIGRRRAIIGVSSRWRPIAADLISSELSDPADHDLRETPSSMAILPPTPSHRPSIPPPQPGEIEVQSPGEDADAWEELVYLLADESYPQEILAPLYLRRSGHEGAWEPASLHSLSVEILERRSGDSVELAAFVMGGSGRLEYAWGAWSLDTIFVEGIRGLGDSSSITVEPGVQNVVLSVRDPLTGASVTAEKTLLAGALQQ
jgi:hypothetical protein